MQQYINISPYRDTSVILYHLSHIDISSIVIYRCINIKTVYLYVQYFMTDAVVVYYGCQNLQLCNYFSAYNFGKSCKNQLIHTSLYRTIYRCIVVQKRQYIKLFYLYDNIRTIIKLYT